MRAVSVLALLGAAEAAIQGFNYGSTFTNGAAKVQSDYEAEFKRAQTLQGTSGWSSARLYTMIQANTANTPSAAIPAAINTNTGLLLGLWASAGQDAFNNELAALKSAINQYGTAFTSLIQGISVGSEDLYRITPTGIENMSGVGADPNTLVSYINQLRQTISGTSASGAPVGHVDTWTAWVNGSNSAVINAVDFLGFDGYPYFQSTQANSIDNAQNLFQESYGATVGVAGGKPVWVTETGWPVSGALSGAAVASVQNAQTYWDQVGCSLFGKTNTWWYTLQDAAPTTPNPSFGIIGSDLSSAPLYDLSCSNIASSSSSSPSTSTTASSATAPASTALSSTVSANGTPGPESVASSVTAALSTLTTSTMSTTGATQPGAVTTVTMTTMLPLSSCPAMCPASSACPADLNGGYQYPHLLVAVDSTQPSTAYGTSYNGTITPAISSIFNFDIPSSYQGSTCSLVFLFPQLSQLQTSSYSFNGMGGIQVSQLSSPATNGTTYNTVPSGSNVGMISNLQAGNGYVVSSGPCAASSTVSYEFSSTGGLSLNFFEDYNPSPLGAYIRVC